MTTELSETAATTALEGESVGTPGGTVLCDVSNSPMRSGDDAVVLARLDGDDVVLTHVCKSALRDDLRPEKSEYDRGKRTYTATLARMAPGVPFLVLDDVETLDRPHEPADD
jgi:hypothetical protein